MTDPDLQEAPDSPDAEHTRPEGVDDAMVEAVDTFSRALETVEAARGHLLQFHRLTGTGDTQLVKAVEQLRDCGFTDLADRIEHDLVGRNVIEGRWTFQVVEEYDDHYYSAWKSLEQAARDEVLGGRRHLLEAEMKEDRRTRGHPHHTARPVGDA